MPTDNKVDLGRRGDLNCIGHEILEVRVNKALTIVFSLIMFWFAVTLVFVGEAVSLWKIDFRFQNIGRWMFLAYAILVVIFHEALHGFAALQWGKVPFSSIRFGIKWRWLALYCHCASPIRMGVFRIHLLLPLMVTTPVTGLVLWLAPSFWSFLLFSIAFSACAGDVQMYFKVQDFRSDLWVQDHPSEPGCYIWPEGQSPSE